MSASLAAIACDQAGTLTGLLAERVRRTPAGVAWLAFDGHAWQTWRWQAVQAEVCRWQQALQASGLQSGDRIALMLPNGPQWVIADLAATGLGLVVVPLYAHDLPGNAVHCLRDSGASLLLLGGPALTAEAVGLYRTACPNLHLLAQTPGPDGTRCVDDWLPAHTDTPLRTVGQPDDLATLVYTSGTTGPPKGVMLSHRNILWNAEACLQRVPLTTDDRMLSILPLSHAFERTVGLYVPMMAGATVAFARSLDSLADDLALHQPTALASVPRIFERFQGRVRDELEQRPAWLRRLLEHAMQPYQRAPGRDVLWRRLAHRLLHQAMDLLVGRRVRARLGGRLRVTVCGGAPLSPLLARWWIALGVPVLQGYGQTEHAPVISVNELGDNVPESVGRPLPGVEVRLSDWGELQVRSPSVTAGYWQRPQDSARTVVDGWLCTGDLARLDEAGRIYLTGRLKEIIVLSNGEKLSPSDLEIAILNDPLFAQVLVVGDNRPYPAALVVLDESRWHKLLVEHGLAPQAVAPHNPLHELLLARIAHQTRQFPSFARIRRLQVLDDAFSIGNGLMTPTLKLKRSKITDLHRDDIERLYDAHP